MKIFTQRLDHTHGEILASITLTYDDRQKSRLRAELPDGEAIAIDLPRTSTLKDGALLGDDEGNVIAIKAAAEPLTKVVSDDPFQLTRAAYHLGNRHVPLMLTHEALYFAPDHVLSEMLSLQGIATEACEHAFEPESGAYHTHHHHDDEHTHSHAHDGAHHH